MIFKALFRPKFQHPDPAVRIKAIQSLDPALPEQKSQLHELAFNDESPAVRLAALEHLDSFALWWKLALTEKNERIHKRAQQQVESMLLAEDGNRLDEKQRQAFVRECSNPALLEKLLLKKWQHDEDTALSLAILSKIAKPALEQKVIQESRNAELCLALLERTDEEAVLNRIARKHPLPELAAAASGKLAGLKNHQQALEKQEKSLRLVLAKMLALKDRQDYQQLETEHKLLISEYQSLSEGLAQQPESLQQELSEKYQQLSDRLYARQRELEPAWREKQQALQRAEQQAAQIAQVQEVTEQLQAQLSQLETCDQAWQQLAISKLEQAAQVLQGLGPDSRPEALQSRLLTLQAQIADLPALQAAIEHSQQLYRCLAEHPLPESLPELADSRQFWQQVRREYRQAQSSFVAIWPQSLQQQWQELDRAWRQSINGLEGQVRELASKVRGSLHKVQVQVQTGKFHAAIGLYQRACQWYQMLPEQEREKQSRLFGQVQERVENLRDWQVYLAQPRKPALLEEVQRLASADLPVQERSDKVKQLRKDWNSLGRIDTEEDEALNQAFDMACEVAFAPVRQYYAEAEQRREQNLKTRLSLLEELNALAGQTVPVERLAETVSQLKQQWRNAGEVDHQRVDELNQAYRQALSPLQERIVAWQQDNGAQKHRLIAKARGLLEQADSLEASEQAKGLQEQWKQTGHAGHKDEKALWQEFRQINDELFARRNTRLQQGREQQERVEKQLFELVTQIRSRLSSSDSQEGVRQALQECREELENLLKQLEGKSAQHWRQRIDELDRLAQEVIAGQQAKQQQADKQSLFELLANWTGTVPQGVEGLPAQWREAFVQQPTSEIGQDRREITLLMELVADHPSPREEQEMRRQLQLQLMASKLQEGEMPNLDKLLVSWIGQGCLTEQDRQLLTRVRQIFE
ncbi:DUF349 domain-containing protein [Bowmanella dokdonensis]|uniref:DUF349 domain-containing protein n=1 Tax=Bowmanella dokdonensis TaxID=751969 RepID=A0A939ISN5_9ALTE|nr:DUF349 domain-containing protein [Bowmanella dokdonensis]MBN7826922.1 DUF349 domain-containing protein [Bowmanella dokdonensis]